jgi:hypothetical protein
MSDRFRLSRCRELRLQVTADPRGEGERVLEFRVWRCFDGSSRPTPVAFFLPLRLVVPVAKAAMMLAQRAAEVALWAPAEPKR